MKHSYAFAGNSRRAPRRFTAILAPAFALGLALGILVSPGPVQSASRTAPVDVCYNMLVVRVIDGDTVYGYIDTSDPVVAVRVNLRLIGIDAPERKSRAKCVAEARKGEAARTYLNSILNRAISNRSRQLARVCHMKRAKYATRRLGRLEVRLRNGWVDMNKLLLNKGYAFRYSGGSRGNAWCDCLQKGDCPAGYHDRNRRVRSYGAKKG